MQNVCLQHHPRTMFTVGFSLVRRQEPHASFSSTSLKATLYQEHLSPLFKAALRSAAACTTSWHFPGKDSVFSTSWEQHGSGKAQTSKCSPSPGPVLAMASAEHSQTLRVLLPSTDLSSGRKPSHGTQPSRPGSWRDATARG